MIKKICVSLSLCASLFANDKNVMYLGEVYDFAERDMIELIHEHIAKNRVEIEQRANKERDKAKENIKKWKPKDMVALTPARENKEFSPNILYTLDRDITDINGTIIYKKGFTFNPAQYVKLHYGIVIIDGTNKDELAWLEKGDFLNSIAYRIFLSNGSYYEMINKYKQDFYYLLPEIAKKFQIKHTPSIVTQRGDKIVVQEICIDCKDKKEEKNK